MLIPIFCLILFSLGLGFLLGQEFPYPKKLREHPEPPALDTAENILNYLEACSLDQNNPEMVKLFSEFKIFADQKQLPSISTIAAKPEWYHNPSATIPQEKHWELFLTDLGREKDPAAKINVVKHWMQDLGNTFSYKEVEMILNEFENSEDRTAIRKIHSAKKKKKK